jgi:hypothetical protein
LERFEVTHFDGKDGENDLSLAVLWPANREAKQPPKP